MLTNKQIEKLALNGNPDEAMREIRRYGTIDKRKDWDVEEGYYKGANSAFLITYRGKQYEIEMLNGEVRSFGWKH